MYRTAPPRHVDYAEGRFLVEAADSEVDTSSPGDEPGLFSHYNCRCREPLDFKKISRFAFF